MSAIAFPIVSETLGMANLSHSSLADTKASASTRMVEQLMQLLKQFAGFRASPQIQRKLERIFQNSADLSTFLHSIENDAGKSQLAALVEDLTNHETYFFRERAHLNALEDVVIPALVQRKKQQGGIKKISLWSAACATGEEAYTLTMLTLNTLVRLGIAHEATRGNITLPADWKLEVLGTDISRQAIRIAREATYTQRQEGLSSFRQFPPAYLRFFDLISSDDSDRKTWQIKDSVRRHVHFDLHNLMNPLPPQREFDVIFCRNALIYMDHEPQKIIVRALHQALQHGGCLMLSLVDTMAVPNLYHENRQNKCVIYEKQ
ncbi:MAG: methyltransferase domain-containing protein [Cellvibrionales bacterium]|nr:methyltransferase domain-containing protein [Cellvibrionales bacterium]